MTVESECHEETRMLDAELALLLLVVHDPGRVDVRGARVDAETCGHAVVEQGPEIHVGWYLNVRQFDRRAAWWCLACKGKHASEFFRRW